MPKRKVLLGPHLIETFHHAMIRILADRPNELSSVQKMYSEIVAELRAARSDVYFSTICSFQALCANVVAGLIQFRHRTAGAMDFGDQILSDSRDLSTCTQRGHGFICQSSHLDRVDVGLTVLANVTRGRGYEYILGCLERIEQRGVGIESSGRTKYRDYVDASVQASSGFRTQEEARAAIKTLEKARRYATLTNDATTGSALAMSLCNFANYSGELELGIKEF